MRTLSWTVAALAFALVSCHDQPAGPDEASLALSADSHDFGEVEVGVPAPAFVLTVTNGGSRPTGQLSARFTTLTGQFQLGPDRCSGQELAPGASCQIQVTLLTGTWGPAQVVLSVSAPGNDSVLATFRGSGFVRRIALINEAVGDFGQVVLGGEAPTETLTIVNRGTIATAALAVLLTGPDSAEFAIASDLCSGQSLSPEATCTVAIRFAPSLEGTKEAYATIVGDPHEIAQAYLRAVVSAPGTIAPNPGQVPRHR